MNRIQQLALLCLLLAFAAFAAGSWVGRDAQLIQRVQPTTQAESDLFGDSSSAPGTPIGQPQQMIIRDQAAFLPAQASAAGTGGVRYVNDTYLTEKGIYPLQLKTVNFFRNVASLGLLALAALLGWWGSRQRRQAQVSIPVTQ